MVRKNGQRSGRKEKENVPPSEQVGSSSGRTRGSHARKRTKPMPPPSKSSSSSESEWESDGGAIASVVQPGQQQERYPPSNPLPAKGSMKIRRPNKMIGIDPESRGEPQDDSFWDPAVTTQIGDGVWVRRKRMFNGNHWIYFRRTLEKPTEFRKYTWWSVKAEYAEGMMKAMGNYVEEIRGY